MGSYAQTIMKDQRLTLTEAQVVAAPESNLEFQQTYPGSLAVGRSASVGDIVFEQYTPLVAQTVRELIESVNLVSTQTIPVLADTFGDAITRQSEVSMDVTKVLGQKLQETQLGQAAILPGIAKYLLVAVAVIIVAGKVWK